MTIRCSLSSQGKVRCRHNCLTRNNRGSLGRNLVSSWWPKFPSKAQFRGTNRRGSNILHRSTIGPHQWTRYQFAKLKSSYKNWRQIESNRCRRLGQFWFLETPKRPDSNQNRTSHTQVLSRNDSLWTCNWICANFADLQIRPSEILVLSSWASRTWEWNLCRPRLSTRIV